jgi:hypothetical protein
MVFASIGDLRVYLLIAPKFQTSAPLGKYLPNLGHDPTARHQPTAGNGLNLGLPRPVYTVDQHVQP